MASAELPGSGSPAPGDKAASHALDPVDRVSEVLFGLFMVLTFTGTLSVASAGTEDVRTMLLAAIGCNTAWGFVDGVMYVLRNLVTRARQAGLARAVRETADPRDAHRLIADEIGEMSAALDAGALESLRQWIVRRPFGPAQRISTTAADLRGGVQVFLLVFASTFPVVLPFVFLADLQTAMRISAGIAIAMMFYCGYTWGRYASLRPWLAGLTMVVLGVLIETVIILLGG
jgi:hypothetical protein